MGASSWPTQSAEALLNFVEGRDLLRNYLGSGRGDDLVRARASFSEAQRSDPEFALATFYLAVVESELRDSDSAISRLESLARRQVEFLPETYLQLAYAHTKKYQDSDYFQAEGALNQALEQSRARGRRDLVLLIEAYRTFLFSVMGGRLRQGERRPYVEKAIELGNRLLKDRTLVKLPAPDREQVLFEIHNALGISYMRRGQQETAFSDSQGRDWELAELNYADALKLRPNATRVLQNIGTLRRAEGDQFFRSGNIGEAMKRYHSALDLYLRSLDLNPRDQFPHYRAAEIAARLGDWDTALKFYESGRLEKGAVKEQTWERLHRAIQTRDSSGLLSDD